MDGRPRNRKVAPGIGRKPSRTGRRCHPAGTMRGGMRGGIVTANWAHQSGANGPDGARTILPLRFVSQGDMADNLEGMIGQSPDITDTVQREGLPNMLCRSAVYKTCYNLSSLDK